MRKYLGVLLFSLIVLACLSPAAVAGAETRKQRVVSFAASCFHESGGALSHPDAESPTLSASHAIVSVIGALDGWADANATHPDWDLWANMSSWVQGFWNDTIVANNTNYGGFYLFDGAENASLTATSLAIQTLHHVNATFAVDYTIVVNFTACHQRLNETVYPVTYGGFADTIDANATIAATYYVLELLGDEEIYAPYIDEINMTIIAPWLNSCQVLSPTISPSYGGFMNSPNATIADLQSTFMAVRSLEILDELDVIDQAAALQFVLSCFQNNTNYPHYLGGYSATPDDIVSTQIATYYAVRTLFILGAESQLQLQNDTIASWVISKQTTEGGFSDTAEGTALAQQTNWAIQTLVLLNQTDLLLEILVYDPPQFPWLIVGGIVVVVFLVILVIFARRRKWI
ncbi:MAG: prenyltransferase/squalene oxidase repeat-containing protein [Promethearchaeota archaeon]